ncbi:MAG: FkbM family methyltransferase [Candidatus Heimdallarchaeota archaeon]|nr:FkbM family methyltransferase [Candidatus Heimdallarchaeota archaeon]
MIRSLISKIMFKVGIKEKYAIIAYSQEGEDLIINRLLQGNKTGFYVDVGAHHPKRFSNTYFFYKKGWNGINIDARPGSMDEFYKVRPRDINIEQAISEFPEKLIYYYFNDPALNGFSKEISMKRENETSYKIIKEEILETQTLKFILDNNINKGQKIDFMSIDVEGLDFQVLKSNDWDLYQPHLIIIEDFDLDLMNLEESETASFLLSKNYILVAKTLNSIIYKNQSYQ